MHTDYKATQAARAVAAKALQATHPHLIQNTKDSLTTAAKNIRIQLRMAFPGVKFSVKTSRFSMGNSIDIRWTDGPTSKQVEAIANEYESGSFDGMTDCYNYREDHAWVDAFGSTKYVQTARDYSDKTIAAIIGRVCRHLGGMDTIPTVDDYRNGRLWNVRTSGGVDLLAHISRALSRHTFCVGEKTPAQADV